MTLMFINNSYLQPHLNILVVCIVSFLAVFLLMFLAMVFLALKYRRRRATLRVVETLYTGQVS